MSPQFQLPFERPIFQLEDQLSQLESQSNPTPAILESIRTVRLELARMKREVFENLDAWDVVKVARHPERPQTLDYIELICDEFIELHGDRTFGDDRAIITGFAKLDDYKVMFIGQQKGRTLKERNECFYGCAHPEGYRKALLKMQMAAKYGLPIVCLIDTPGAYPGVGAEERGQAYTIAYNLREMARLPVPIISVVIGEGGSGGALGIGIGNTVSVLQFAYYSVISPEGCAGILWKHVKFADKAARALKFTGKDLLRFGIVDEVIPEPLGGAHRDHRAMATNLKATIVRQLRALLPLSGPELLEQRYQKFRKIGEFDEVVQAKISQETPTAEQTLVGHSK
ncbi:acetyl-CoA carboxylase carboxyltransferase subunit alpha [Planctopirus hydrillae]|uniref:Acetyl-coenzyme A carboxylase carboxyl transferase subunit alpha n=1 Tax=Planctopirus hydrillae TaxID=1841610 RepID=A0A1C3E414_9PLAN|nr:acetyl-CoA carboxylase carboxyltransferase subunit alpha [Planctopirus hydrillae]ODA27970.1 acetyl-CoA carboxylase carboxyltransferase subunit alpha [Planctopirus hydrillae]